MLVSNILKLNVLLAKQSCRRFSDVFAIEPKGHVARIPTLSYFELLPIPFDEASELPSEEVAMMIKGTLKPIRDRVYAINPDVKVRLLADQDYFRLLPLTYKESLDKPGTQVAAFADDSLIHYIVAEEAVHHSSSGSGDSDRRYGSSEHYIYEDSSYDFDGDLFRQEKKKIKKEPVKDSEEAKGNEESVATKKQIRTENNDSDFPGDDFAPKVKSGSSVWDTTKFEYEPPAQSSSGFIEGFKETTREIASSIESFSSGGDSSGGSFGDD